MHKSVGAAVWGLFTFVSVFAAAVLAAWVVLGPDRAAPGGQVSAVWGVMACGAALLGGFFAGVPSRLVAKDMKPPLLVMVIVVVGLAAALGARGGPGASEAPPPAASEAEASSAAPAREEGFGPALRARAPLWLIVVCPLMGGIGVFGGARLFHSLKARDNSQPAE